MTNVLFHCVDHFNWFYFIKHSFFYPSSCFLCLLFCSIYWALSSRAVLFYLAILTCFIIYFFHSVIYWLTGRFMLFVTVISQRINKVQLMMDYLDWCPDLKNVFPLVFSRCECVMSHKRSAAVVTEKLWEVAADGLFDAGGFPSLRSFLCLSISFFSMDPSSFAFLVS